MSSDDKSLGTLVRELTEEISTLIRSEIALAKLELKQTFTSLGIVGGLFGSALFFALVGLAFLFVTLILVLGIFMPHWLAALIITVVLFLLATAAALIGRARLKKVTVVPTATVENIKADIDSIRSDLSRAKQKST
jgi:uncharacterized membrane protein YqjE